VAEIKSTLDLVMEKVRKLEITPEEREEFHRKEEEEKARGIFSRYLKGRGERIEALREELSKTPESVKRALVSLICQEFSFPSPSENWIEALELLKGKGIGEKVRGVVERYRKEREEETERVKGELRRMLSKRGIRGDAVDPNPETHPSWEKSLKGLEEKAREELKEILGLS